MGELGSKLSTCVNAEIASSKVGAGMSTFCNFSGQSSKRACMGMCTAPTEALFHACNEEGVDASVRCWLCGCVQSVGAAENWAGPVDSSGAPAAINLLDANGNQVSALATREHTIGVQTSA